jgi:predicted ATPase
MIIEKLGLENFKCFKKTEIEFGKITLLTGANSSGKSSLIDALLAVMQTEKFPLYLSPNGKYKNMGGFENISYQNKNELIKIILDFPEILFGDKNHGWETGKWKIGTSWQISSNSAMPMLNFLKSEFQKGRKISAELFLKNNKYVMYSNSDNEDIFDNKEYSSLNDFYDYQFEGALFGDVETLPKMSENLDLRFNFIHSFREEPQRHYYQVAKTKNKISPSGLGFAQQIAEWEETNPEKIETLTKYLQDLKLLYSIQTEKRSDGTFQILVKTHKNSIAVPLTDVGFGVSKILPLLVADLQLEFVDNEYNNCLLIISEPEIDLHPSVQALLADYLAKQVLENQRQYIIETHSEYIINRLRLLIAKNELQETDVKTYFFTNDGKSTTTYPINFAKDGRIENAPKDFFETYEVDVMEIAMLG